MKRMRMMWRLAVLICLGTNIIVAQLVGYEYNNPYNPSSLKDYQAKFYKTFSKQEREIYQSLKNTAGILVFADSARVKNLGFRIVRTYSVAGQKWYELPRTADNDATVNYLNSLGVLAYNLEYGIVKTQALPADSIPTYLLYPERKWGLKTIGFFDKSIANLRTSENDAAKVTIFVLDTGGPCDSSGVIDHPYFQARGRVRLGGNHVPRPDTLYWHWDWTYPPRDRNGHGTHVGGIIADVNRSDSLVFVKVLGASGFGYWIWVQAGIQEVIDYALATGRPVVANISLGGDPWAPTEYQLKYIDSLIIHAGLKISFVCAAGNTGSELVIWPAAYGHQGFIRGYTNGYSFITSVGAIQLDEKGAVTQASYSAYGRYVDVFAPGGGNYIHDSVMTILDGKWYRLDSTSILSTATVVAPVTLDYWLPRYYRDPRDPATVDSLHRYLSGTSMATPHAAATHAWFLGRHPDFPISELRERLKNTGIPFTFLGLDSIYAYEGKYLYLPYLFGARFKVKVLSYSPKILTDTVGVGTKLVFRIDSVATESSEPVQFRWLHNNAVIGSNNNSVEVVFWDAGWHTIIGIASAGEDMDYVSWSVFVNPLTAVEKSDGLPTAFALHQNYPNPFNPSTTIQYDLPKSGMVRLSVYDVLGREVRILVDEYQDVGRYTVRFDASNLSSGVYFYRLIAGEFVAVKKFQLLK